MIGFILDQCIVYLGLTMPNLQKKRLLIFEIFNIKKCTLSFGTVYIKDTILKSVVDLLHYLEHTFSKFHLKQTNGSCFTDNKTEEGSKSKFAKSVPLNNSFQ